jgi:hypothetical protein
MKILHSNPFCIPDMPSNQLNGGLCFWRGGSVRLAHSVRPACLRLQWLRQRKRWTTSFVMGLRRAAWKQGKPYSRCWGTRSRSLRCWLRASLEPLGLVVVARDVSSLCSGCVRLVYSLCPSGVRFIWVVIERCKFLFCLIQWYASRVFEKKKAIWSALSSRYFKTEEF